MALLEETNEIDLDLQIHCFEDGESEHDQELVSSDGAFQVPGVAPGRQLVVFDPLTDSLAMLNKDCSAVAPSSRSCGSGDGQSLEAGEMVDLEGQPNVEQLELRHYQEELVPHALQGSNVVICAPTGSGKTLVAVRIILHHLQSTHFKKVIFFVPTVPLVEQQSSVIRRFLPPPFRVRGIAGCSGSGIELPKAQIVANNDVLVMTPAILLNLLDASDDIALMMRICDFSLFVFDECHHAVKDHVYVKIMMRYFAELRSLHMDQINLPQIVGLSASLTGKADSYEKAYEAVMNMCAQLDCHYLETVQVHTEELKRMVIVPKEEVACVPSCFSRHPFSFQVKLLMEEIEIEVAKLVDKTSNLVKPLSKQISKSPWKDGYADWIGRSLNEVPLVKDVQLCRNLSTYFQILKAYQNSLYLVGHIPARLAFNYLISIMDDFASRACQAVDEDILDSFNRRKPFLRNTLNHPDAPIVIKLKEILVKEYHSSPESRTIIFVRTRELAEALERYMTEDEELRPLRAATLVGINSAERSGQTAADQRRCVDNFKAGIHKAVVATSVADEGLDVVTCNLVIKYNHVIDVATLIQRRGRGRAQDSRCILLTHDASVPSRELQNMQGEQLVKRAVEKIANSGTDLFRMQMESRQDLAWEKREDERKRKIDQPQILGNNIFLLQCKICKATVCRSCDMRVINGSIYVAVDPRVWSRLTTAAMEAKCFDTVSHVAKLCCTGQCRGVLGVVIKYSDAYMPCLSIRNFIISEGEDQSQHNPNSWTSVTQKLFVVDSIEQDDIKRMNQAVQPPKHLDRVIDRWLREN